MGTLGHIFQVRNLIFDCLSSSICAYTYRYFFHSLVENIVPVYLSSSHAMLILIALFMLITLIMTTGHHILLATTLPTINIADNNKQANNNNMEETLLDAPIMDVSTLAEYLKK